MTLQQVSDHCGTRGDRIPVSTLARIESGRLDPGIRRLHLLLQLYKVPPHLLADLVELDRLAVGPPVGENLEQLLEAGVEHWKSGNIGEGLAYLMTVRQYVSSDEASRPLRQKATLAFAVAARNLGKLQLAKQVVDELLQEELDDVLLTRILILSSSIWRALGSAEMALATINRAAQRIGSPDDLDAAFVLHQEAKLQAERGDPQRAAESLTLATRVYKRLGDSYSEARAKVLRVAIAEKLDGTRAALSAARSAIRFAQKHKFKRIAAYARIEVGRLQIAEQRLPAGLDSLREGLAEAVRIDDQGAQFLAHFHLWKTHAAGGETDRARFEFEAAANCVQHLEETTAEADEVRRELARRTS